MNIHLKFPALFLNTSFRDTLGQIFWEAATKQDEKCKRFIRRSAWGKMGRELGRLAELCHHHADLTPTKERGREELLGRRVLSRHAVLRKCQKSNGEYSNQSYPSEESCIFLQEHPVYVSLLSLAIGCSRPCKSGLSWATMVDFREQQLGCQSITLLAFRGLRDALLWPPWERFPWMGF